MNPQQSQPYTAPAAYSHDRRQSSRPNRPMMQIVAPVSSDILANEMLRLSSSARLLQTADYEVYCVRFAEAPSVLREIARLREHTFRAVGEGTGQALDTDSFDEHYHHLFVWSVTSAQVVGAYRLGWVDELRQAHGSDGFYCSTLFDFEPALFDRIGPSIELGRSFVRKEWQGSTRVLRLLWAGIGLILDRSPQIETLFGAVSISSQYSQLSRWLIMSALRRHHTDAALGACVRARNAPAGPDAAMGQRIVAVTAGLADPVRLSRILRFLERGTGLPMLIKHYIELRGRFAAFNVDGDFNDALDGLVFVRSQDIPAKLRKRLRADGKIGPI